MRMAQGIGTYSWKFVLICYFWGWFDQWSQCNQWCRLTSWFLNSIISFDSKTWLTSHTHRWNFSHIRWFLEEHSWQTFGHIVAKIDVRIHFKPSGELQHTLKTAWCFFVNTSSVAAISPRALATSQPIISSLKASNILSVKERASAWLWMSSAFETCDMNVPLEFHDRSAVTNPYPGLNGMSPSLANETTIKDLFFPKWWQKHVRKRFQT